MAFFLIFFGKSPILARPYVDKLASHFFEPDGDDECQILAKPMSYSQYLHTPHT